MVTDSELTMQARSIARSLTYNDDAAQAAAKHALLELAHRLDSRDVRVQRTRDGFRLRNGIGKERFMTAMESIKYRLFGSIPAAV